MSLATIGDFFLDLDRHADRTAMTWTGAGHGVTSISYAELAAAARDWSGAIAARGAEPGTVVALIGQPDLVWYAAFGGVQINGSIAAPLSPMYAPAELEPILRRLDPALVIIGGAVRPETEQAIRRAYGARCLSMRAPLEQGAAVRPRPGRRPDQSSAAVILHTSGTTGLPKAVMQSHENYLGFARWWGPQTMTGDDRVLNFLAPIHQGGLLLSVLAPLSLGAQVTQIGRMTADQFWEGVRVGQCTVALLMSPGPGILLSQTEPESFREHPLRRALGGSTPERQRAAIAERFGIVFTHEQMGSTETTLFTLGGARDRTTPVPHGGLGGPRGGAAVGYASSEWAEVRIAAVADADAEVPPGESGEIQVRGRGVFIGYLADPDQTSRALTPSGWFRTGDLGYMTEDGAVYCVDRLRHVIRRSGENIAPAEIARVLGGMESVDAVAIFGVPDEVRGEEIMAVVVPRAGQTIDPSAVVAYCRERLTAFKVPRYIEFRTELPLTHTGKVRTESLREGWEQRVDYDRTAGSPHPTLPAHDLADTDVALSGGSPAAESGRS